MPFEYLEHISDVGIRATGATLEEAFEDGAKAVLAVMFDLSTIVESSEVEVEAEAPEVDLLFVEVINEVLSLQGRDELALKRLEAESIEKTGEVWSFRGRAFGQRLDLSRHEVKTEVKGATYSLLRYEKSGGLHTLECVVDV